MLSVNYISKLEKKKGGEFVIQELIKIKNCNTVR